jgi:malate/lactate dehydrogenase
MGGALDSALCYLSLAMNVSPSVLRTTVVGGHGDVPLTRLATGTPVADYLDALIP